MGKEKSLISKFERWRESGERTDNNPPACRIKGEAAAGGGTERLEFQSISVACNRRIFI